MAAPTCLPPPFVQQRNVHCHCPPLSPLNNCVLLPRNTMARPTLSSVYPNVHHCCSPTSPPNNRMPLPPNVIKSSLSLESLTMAAACPSPSSIQPRNGYCNCPPSSLPNDCVPQPRDATARPPRSSLCPRNVHHCRAPPSPPSNCVPLPPKGIKSSVSSELLSLLCWRRCSLLLPLLIVA
jgi:hypothetical protein